jgi:thiol-disulfide isomerase/thioredoxin
MQEDQLREAITQFGYTIMRIETVEDCDPETKQFPDIWADTEGLDASVISRGERVDLESHLTSGKWTIFDFGAPWCGPCHASEKLLRIFLRDNPDVALRAIILDSQNANESYAMPVVQQHLQSAPGLPYFVVMDPKGKVFFRGSEVDKLLKKMDKRK